MTVGMIACTIHDIRPDCLSAPIDRHSGPHRIQDKLFSNTRYFVIKSNNHENIAIAKERVSTN